MTKIKKSRTVLDGFRRRPFRCAALAWLTGIVCLAFGGASAGAPPRVVRTTAFLPDLSAVVRADGSWELSSPAGAALLTLRLEDPDAALVRLRARMPADEKRGPHVARVVEGCPGGLRGPGERADDDDDGLVDEDPLDGRDNDGDGLLDEDFAAVSDAMLAVTRADAEGGGHVEYYSWGHAHLKSTLFASARGRDGSRLVLNTVGSDWTSTPVALQQHSVTGKTLERSVVAVISRLDSGGTCQSAQRWVGVAILDRDPPGRIGSVRIEGRRLTITTGDEPVAIAVCAAESWLQLARMLVDAQRIRDGVADPVTGATTPWVVAPRCPSCRTGSVPEFRWRTDRWGGVVLSAMLSEGAGGLPDPDLFRVGASRLGAPERISWRPRDGDVAEAPWFCAASEPFAGRGNPGDPYAALPGVRLHGATGRLEFRFADPSPALLRALTASVPDDDGAAGAVQLAGVAVDGRSFVAALKPDIVVDDALQSAVALARGGASPEDPTPADQPEELRNSPSRPSLSPELLKGWPNPFDDAISLRFEIPQTIGQAFTWNSDEDRPANLDLSAPVPWKNGVPEASVKIYTMSGQHLVTLHTGQVASGSVTVRWNATDAFGRRVASGNYICKLQLDDWSVTRRLTFVR